MDYPHTATTDPYASLDASAVSEEAMMAWAQAAGYSQPGLTSDGLSFADILDATVAWGQSATLHAATYGLQNTSDTDWTSGGTAPVGDMLGRRGLSLADAAATDTMAFAPAPTDGMDAFTQDFFLTQSDFSNSLASTPSLTNVSSVPSPQGDGIGDGFVPFPTFEEATSYFVQPGPSSSQLYTPGALLPNQFTCVPPPFIGDGNLAGLAPPDYRPTLDLMGSSNLLYLEQLDDTAPNNHLEAPIEALTTMVARETVPSSSLGKRSQRSDEDESGGRTRKRRGRADATRVPRGAESVKRTRRSPATRTQKNDDDISKAAGRGAERLASATARGVYHRSLLGLSVPQGSVGALELGQPSWIEERDVETWHDTGSSVPQQIVVPSAENAEDGEDLHAIPGNLSQRERSMLQTTQADEEGGSVRLIKCKLCPTARFSTWETYKRHCKSCEKHPARLKFCPKCGDYFGRPDSGIRHKKDEKYKKACLETSPDEAREKKQTVERLLQEFEARLGHCLKTGKEIGPRFSDIVNGKLTNTSKKVSK